MAEKQPNIQGLPTIYDVERATDVSSASVSRVLNGHRNTGSATRDRVRPGVVAMTGAATGTTGNVRSESGTGMTELARYLIRDHGYLTMAYVMGPADSPRGRDVPGQRPAADSAEGATT